MKIEELKRSIENKTIDNSPLVLVYKDTGRIICEQYINEISVIRGLEINYLDEEPDMSFVNLFGEDKASLNIIFTDNYSGVPQQNYIICCHNTSYNNAVNIPELEDWQILDYAKGVLPGVKEESVDWLCNICTDKHRLMQEIDKIKIFDKTSQDFVFNALINSDGFGDLTNHNIFNLSNSIQKKDIKTLMEIMLKIENIDVNPIGLNNLLFNNFRDIMAIKTSPNTPPQTLGIQPKKYNALRYYVNYFTVTQLSHILRLLVNTDQAIKSGDISVDMLTDYIITHIFA